MRGLQGIGHLPLLTNRAEMNHIVLKELPHEPCRAEAIATLTM